MSQKNTVLTPKQRRFIPFFLAEPVIERAALAAGISRSTVYRWLAERPFKAVLDRMLDENLVDFSRQIGLSLGDLGPKAIETLKAVLDDPNASLDVRVRAAAVAIDRLIRISENRSK